MAVSSIQDRTSEFRSVLTQVQKRQASSKVGAQRQSLLTDSQKATANGSATGDGKPRRSEFARRAAEIGRGISVTMGKLEKLAQCTTILLPGSWILNADHKQWPRGKRSSMTDQSRSMS
jgi:syntaxin 5